MKNKTIINILSFILLCINIEAFPVGKATFHLTDDDHNPLNGVSVGMGSILPSVSGDANSYKPIFGKTDAKGFVTLEAQAFIEMSYEITSFSGYYNSGGSFHFTNVIGDKLQPWNPIVDVVVRPIINPIAMYAQAVRLTIPTKNAAVGYDLEAGDWVAPYGKGSVSDFVFTAVIKIPFVSMTEPYYSLWTLSFSNKGDGIQHLKTPKVEGSALKFPRYAPQDGYLPALVQEDFHQGSKWQCGQAGEDFFFRVRTVLDENGNVKSALYGKIPGAIICGTRRTNIQFTYYLNPTPNDRNMEFDPKKNLFNNLDVLQQVTAP